MVDLTINGGSQTLDGTYTYDYVNITNGGTLYITPYNGTGTTGRLILNAIEVNIDSTSSINGLSRGYRGGAGGHGGGYIDADSGGKGGELANYGGGSNNIGAFGYAGGGAGGGGYGTPGGLGGYGHGSGTGSPAAGGTIQGTSNGSDIQMGNGGGGGGGNSQNTGGNGNPGGATLTINANSISINGSVIFDGGTGGNGGAYGGAWPGGGGGGASGGGILFNGTNINITGTITAQGGLGGNSGIGGYGAANGEAGGGGRIKIFCSGTYNNTGTVSAGTVQIQVLTGNVSFTSTPSGAEVFIDTVDQGVTTPSNIITGLIPGTNNHTYKLTKVGYADATGTFSITPGINTPISVTFAGSAYITSTPSGARIWIDAGDTGINTPATITGLTAGYRVYSLVLAGRDNTSGSFTAIAGQTVNIPVTLLTPANIGATLIHLDSISTPCILGICVATVSVTWKNTGGSSGSSDLSITISGGSPTITPSVYSSVPFMANEEVTRTFTISNMTVGAHITCPYPN
jgi:hypothetical protein